MAEANLSELSREIHRVYPKGKRQPVRLLALWQAVMHSWEQLPASTRDLSGLRLSESDRSSIGRDVGRWKERMATYRDALQAARPDDAAGVYRTVTRGLVINFPGSGHHVADALFVPAFLNMVAAGEQTHRDAWSAFVADLGERIRKVVVEPAKTTAKAALSTIRLAPVLVGIAGSVAAGLIVWRITAPRRR